MNYQIADCKFLGAYRDGDPSTGFSKPEVALIGRSNVGKSSLINRITATRNLARTSNTPGRTKELMLFEGVLSGNRAAKRKIILADLPGYGYAKVSKVERANLQNLISTYLHNRNELQVVCLLNDCRRLPEEEEFLIRKLVYDRGIALQIVLTKCDKLKAGQRVKQIKEVAAGYGLEPADLVLTGDKMPVSSFWESIAVRLND